jgi:hypothetical protein
MHNSKNGFEGYKNIIVGNCWGDKIKEIMLTIKYLVA